MQITELMDIEEYLLECFPVFIATTEFVRIYECPAS